MRDGSVYVHGNWCVDTQTSRIEGEGELLNLNREVLRAGTFAVDLDSVALFETNVVGKSGPTTALAMVTGISAVMTLACISNPKACFGSCPTFFAETKEGWALLAEGFSASIAPSLEATDVDALRRWRPASGRVELKMTNEALETHVVRWADLLAIPLGPGQSAGITSGGEFRLLDLAARATIDLDFEVPESGDWGLILGLRQSLMTTYLFYQGLSWLGQDAAHWLARLESMNSEDRARLGNMWTELGGVEVQVAEDGVFTTVGEVRETGPLAIDYDVVELPALDPGPVRIRLRLVQGLWRVDLAGLVRLGKRIEPLRLAPTLVLRGDVVDEAARESLLDPGSTLVTLPGDEYRLVYEPPPGPGGWEPFLESRGYYLEWMRDEWMVEEDPALAARMLLMPRQSLRDLAASYKAVESDMEALFCWSRYAHP